MAETLGTFNRRGRTIAGGGGTTLHHSPIETKKAQCVGMLRFQLAACLTDFCGELVFARASAQIFSPRMIAVHICWLCASPDSKAYIAGMLKSVKVAAGPSRVRSTPGGA